MRSLRAIGQVAYVNSAISCLIILIGSFVVSPPVAVLGFASTMIGTVIGLNIPVRRKDANNGLHGYDGFLAGAGVGYFDSGLRAATKDWSRVPYLSVPLILFAVSHSFTLISGYEYFGINAVLAAVGIGCFCTVPSFGSVIFAVLSSIITVAVRSVFLDYVVSDGPTLTFLFCVTFFLIHAVRVIEYPFVVPESVLECPKRNWAFRLDYLISARKRSDVNADESHNAVWPDQPDSSH